MTTAVIGIIGGSGLYNLDGLSEVTEVNITTPYGAPSSPILRGKLGDVQLLFIARHGKGHVHTPSGVNYRANVYALKKLGATHVISVSAVGSLQEEIRPGDLVVVNQYIDRTKGRSSTFFEEGLVGHVMFADPVCPDLSAMLFECASKMGFTVHKDATLMVMEGPAFSTRAESNLHRQMGADLIGMTAMPEAKLAREAELCYATLALATDYDCWHETLEDVTVDAVIKIMKDNVEKARRVVAEVSREIHQSPTTCDCGTSLEYAIVTDKEMIPDSLKEKLAPIVGRVI